MTLHTDTGEVRLRPEGPAGVVRHRPGRHVVLAAAGGAGTYRLTCGFLVRVNGIGGLPPVPFGMLDSARGDVPTEETAMDPLTVDPAPGPGQDWDDLVRIWEETDAPEGCKVEIIEEIVTV